MTTEAGVRTIPGPLLLGIVLALSPACGGGGGSSKKTTPSPARPVLAETLTPLDGATGVSANAIIRVTFNKPVDWVTVQNGVTFLLTDSGAPGSALPGTFFFDGTGLMMTFTPSAPLAFSTGYQVDLTAGIVDTAGDPLDPSRSLVPIPSGFQTQGTPDLTAPNFGGATGATGLDNTSIQVDWNPAVDDVDPQSSIVYNVYASLVPGGQVFSTPTVTSPAGATSLVVGSLLPGTTYYVVVRAEDTSGNEDSNVVEVSAATTAAPDLTPPVFAGATGAAAVDSVSIQVDWFPASDNADPASAITYNVYAATTPGGQVFATPTVTSVPGATGQVVGGLNPSTTYYFVVRAEDTSGNEETNTVEVSATTLAPPDITAPTFGGATGASAMDSASIQVGWAAATDDRDSPGAIVYNLYVATTAGGQVFGTPTLTSAAGATSQVVGGLLPLTAYYVVVRAEDTSGNEDTNVVEVSATTLAGADVTPPVFGGATGATAIDSVSIQVDWAAATDDQDPPATIIYNVYASAISGGQNFAAPDVTSAPGTVSEVVAGLAPSTTYYFVVRAEDTSGNEDTNVVEVSATTTAGADVLPPIFGGATGATALDDTNIQVDWTAAVDNVDPQSAIVYNVYVSTAPGGQNFAAPDATSAPGGTSQVMGGLTPSTAYYFVVRAEDTSGNEDTNTVEVSATTTAGPDLTPPVFGGATAATALNNTSIQVDWAAATDDTDPPGAILYNVYVATSSGSQNFAAPDVTSAAGATTQVVGGLTASTTYFVVVRAKDTSGNEDTNIIEVNATTLSNPDVTPPTFGGATAATPIDSTSIQVDWAAATDDTDPPGAIVYNVYAAASPGGQSFASPDVTSPPGATSQVVGGLSPSTTYYFVVRAQDTAGNEDTNVVEVSAATPAPPDLTPPIFGGATSAVAASSTSIQVSWTAAVDNVDPQAAIVYNVYMAASSGGQNFAAPTVTSAPGVTSQVVGGLSPSTTYYFVVRAEDTSGNEELNTVEVSDTTPAPPDVTPPTFGGATAATPVDSTSIQVDWAAATDDTDPPGVIVYNVYMAGIPGGQNFAAPDATSPPGATSQVVGGLTPSTTYYFVVRAEDTSGNEDTNTVEVSATTPAPPDITPPVFAGVQGTSVISPTEILLSWNAATDDTDPPGAIVYNVYLATSAGGQNFALPDDTSLAGATSHIVTTLTQFTDYYFVVRAEDTSGNEDTNTVELMDTTMASFSSGVLPIFLANCATGNCHNPPGPRRNLDLSSWNGVNTTGINVPSGHVPTMDFIEPFDSLNSYVMHKIDGTQGSVGGSGGQMGVGSPQEADNIRAWINEGALNN